MAKKIPPRIWNEPFNPKGSHVTTFTDMYRGYLYYQSGMPMYSNEGIYIFHFLCI